MHSRSLLCDCCGGSGGAAGRARARRGSRSQRRRSEERGRAARRLLSSRKSSSEGGACAERWWRIRAAPRPRRRRAASAGGACCAPLRLTDPGRCIIPHSCACLSGRVCKTAVNAAGTDTCPRVLGLGWADSGHVFLPDGFFSRPPCSPDRRIIPSPGVSQRKPRDGSAAIDVGGKVENASYLVSQVDLPVDQ